MLRSDLFFGAVALLAVVLAVFFFVAGEADAGAEAAPPPPITVLAPRSGATVSGPFSIVFETPARMERDASGWVAEGRYHLHAMVGGTELMAAPADVQPVEGGRYRWSVAGLPPGEHRVRLQWAGPDHRNLQQGGSAPFTLLVR
ncbi:MAG TPA: hypothetical protein VGR37_03735 [Longimicrobiaceae bacterium]|nr:hypothetical protein [Longimicrobiaceae bacterium]